ncbi:MAG: hypothetical protein KatS3mg068_1959 [Candidatus Sericytochromatia bacterium]|nr:MAG: hypothetical protein KatS3mg068_1959 [Candidatus Sericytochromatia bacterium]
MLLKVLLNSGKNPNQLYNELILYPQVLLNVKVNRKNELDSNINIKNSIEYLKKELGFEGRILVRASGTEPLIRILVEGKDRKLIKSCAENLYKIIEKRIKLIKN